MRLPLLMILSSLLFTNCKNSAPLPTVSEVDLQKYSGTWYEIARFPNRFERGLECVTAEYSPKENGNIRVVNSGVKKDKPGKIDKASGTAWVPDPAYPGRLKVRFFWPFAGDYYIIALDDGYRYVLVGSPDRDYLWILSREKTLEESIYNELLQIAAKNGFDVSKLEMIDQSC